jgi:DNA-binding NtrC family response regulator
VHRKVVLATTMPTLAQTLADAERGAIDRALHAAGGSKNQAAALLGISRSQFYDKLKRHGIAG